MKYDKNTLDIQTTLMLKHLKDPSVLKSFVAIGLLKKLLWVVLIFTTSVFAQKENKHIRQGNNNYYEENYKDAEVDYMRALEKRPESVKGQYNLGGALYKQENYEDATKLFGNVAGQDLDTDEKASAYYNLGNSYLKSQKFPEAIDSYKNALRLKPNDEDAKYNLAYANKMMQQQEQEQNQDQDKNEEDKENKDKQDQKKDQEQKNKEQQQDQQNQDQQQDEQNQEGQQNQSQQQPQPQQISKQDAERMLEALKNDENKTLEKVKLQQVPTKAKKTEKDW